MKVEPLLVSGSDLAFIDGDMEIGVFSVDRHTMETVIVFTNPKIIELLGGQEIRGNVVSHLSDKEKALIDQGIKDGIEKLQKEEQEKKEKQTNDDAK